MTMLTANELDDQRRREVAERVTLLYRAILTDLCNLGVSAQATEDFKADPQQSRNYTSYRVRDVEVPIVFTMERKGDLLRVNGKVTIVVGPFKRNHVFRDRKNGHDTEAIANCIADWVQSVDADALRRVEIEKRRNERKDFASRINKVLGADPDVGGPFLAVNKFDDVYIEVPSDLSDDNLFLILRFMKKELGL